MVFLATYTKKTQGKEGQGLCSKQNFQVASGRVGFEIAGDVGI